MADPTEEKIDKPLDEPAVPKHESDLSATDLQKVSGGVSPVDPTLDQALWVAIRDRSR
jgi:hypothetical protein